MAVEPGATLEAFKTHLNKTSAGDDDELLGHLLAATQIAESDPEFGIGPIVTREVTSSLTWVKGGLLPIGPVISVTGLAGDYDYTTDDVTVTDAGVITGTSVVNGDYVVTYQAGRADATEDVPEDIQLAVCIIGKHLWETQRGRSANRVGNIPDDGPQMGYLIPHRAASILRGHRPWTVFA